jgi:enoyl-CoA hydratase/carnithine racemase
VSKDIIPIVAFNSKAIGTMFSIASRAIRNDLSKVGLTSISRHLAASHVSYRCYHSEQLKDSYENLLVSTHQVAEDSENQVALMQLNRPKALNALSDAVLDDVLHAARVLDSDPKVRCLILTGSRKAFAAGADISEMHSKTFSEAYGSDMFGHWQNLSQLKKPLLAAVSGYCLGGGCEVAMMCDMIVCSESAKFGQPEINLGVIAGGGGTQRLTRAIGKSKSMYMHLTGEFIDAKEAYESGLVAKVFSDDDLIEETMKIAKSIASKGPLSVQAAKEAVNASEELPLWEGLRLERRLFHSLFATEDQKEGMQAFLEKRPANFS